MPTTQIYVTKSTRHRLKALAHIDQRHLSKYLELISKQLLATFPNDVKRKAIEATEDREPLGMSMSEIKGKDFSK